MKIKGNRQLPKRLKGKDKNVSLNLTKLVKMNPIDMINEHFAISTSSIPLQFFGEKLFGEKLLPRKQFAHKTRVMGSRLRACFKSQ
jgi:hypothetical protein